MAPAAFPVPLDAVDEGMTMRDYIVIALLPAIYGSDIGVSRDEVAMGISFERKIVTEAYDIADMMLKVRHER